MAKKKSTDDLKNQLIKKSKKDEPIRKEDLLSSGSAMVNLACTGRTIGAFVKGHYYLLVGDSDSGKTWLTLGTLAEACANPNFDDYDLVYNNAEQGVLMDIKRFFGAKLAARLQFTKQMETVDEMYFDLDDRFKAIEKGTGKPFIYILDSENALTSLKDLAKFEKTKKAVRKKAESGGDEKIAGSFGDGKAAIHSSNLRKVCSRAHKHKCIIIFISQSRDNLDPMSMEKQRQTGGRALKFYATLQIWTSKKGTLKTRAKGKDRQQGILSQIRIKKNRIVGRDRKVVIPIYHSFGIDDVGSCVDYLLDEKHWKKGDGGIRAKEFGVTLGREELIKHIEENNLERDLRVLCKEVWDEIEAATAIERKPRYE